MHGENNGSKPYEQIDDLVVFPLFLVQHHIADRVSVWDPNSFQMMVTGNHWWATGGCPSELTIHCHVRPIHIP